MRAFLYSEQPTTPSKYCVDDGWSQHSRLLDYEPKAPMKSVPSSSGKVPVDHSDPTCACRFCRVCDHLLQSERYCFSGKGVSQECWFLNECVPVLVLGFRAPLWLRRIWKGETGTFLRSLYGALSLEYE
jgi:hypothetical protein